MLTIINSYPISSYLFTIRINLYDKYIEGFVQDFDEIMISFVTRISDQDNTFIVPMYSKNLSI